MYTIFIRIFIFIPSCWFWGLCTRDAAFTTPTIYKLIFFTLFHSDCVFCLHHVKATRKKTRFYSIAHIICSSYQTCLIRVALGCAFFLLLSIRISKTLKIKSNWMWLIVVKNKHYSSSQSVFPARWIVFDNRYYISRSSRPSYFVQQSFERKKMNANLPPMAICH